MDTPDIRTTSGPKEITDRIVANLREIYDPEIPVNIYDLGLIYEVNVDEATGKADIVMTLTAPNCPAAGILPGQAEDAARKAEGVTEVELDLTFDPPFTRAMMSEEAKLELGLL